MQQTRHCDILDVLGLPRHFTHRIGAGCVAADDPSTRNLRAPPRSLGSTITAHPCGSQFHSLYDPLIASTTTQVARQRIDDLLPGGVWLTVEECLGRHKHSGRAVATLHSADLNESLLEWVEMALVAQAFDSQDTPSGYLTHKGKTGTHRLAIKKHCTGTAFTLLVASLFSASQAKIVPQHIQQRAVGVNLDRDGLPVQDERQLHSHGLIAINEM
jgi:hypothetical protein